jgi:L-ascorbate metabolism protein UlaG (beta-lactamase superfamily)
MDVTWHGQSAFHLRGREGAVMLDPFGAVEGIKFEYPPIAGVTADLVLITHEHADHNDASVVAGSPVVLRSTAGRLDSPVGPVLAVASEHDAVAGTESGPNTIFCFTLDGVRVSHFGDFGQRELRPEQAAAIGTVDLLLIPVGGGATIDGAAAVAIAERLSARWIVPMHYRNERFDFVPDGVDGLLAHCPEVARLDGATFDTAALPDGEGLVAVVPSVP